MIYNQAAQFSKDLKESLKSNGLSISIGLVAINAVFISVSAVMFMEMENSHMVEATKESAQRYANLKHWMKQQQALMNAASDVKRSYQLDDSEWIRLKALHKPRCFKHNNDQGYSKRFNFWSSLDFCSTVISTIGYGSLYPDRDLGKMFSILYALIGIPIMLCFLNICCDALSGCVSATIRLISKQMGLQTKRIIKVCVILFVLCSYILGLSGILTHYSKKDTMLDSLYFYVITLTTTGIGDISMTDYDALILVRVFAVFLLGLTLVTTLINSMREAAKKRVVQKDWKTFGGLAMTMMMMNSSEKGGSGVNGVEPGSQSPPKRTILNDQDLEDIEPTTRWQSSIISVIKDNRLRNNSNSSGIHRHCNGASWSRGVSSSRLPSPLSRLPSPLSRKASRTRLI